MSILRVRVRNEHGMALVGVMLLLILASGVCAALAVSGKTETMAAYNLDTSAQARAAAQAGLTAAAEVVIDYLIESPLDLNGAMDAMLAGPDADNTTVGDNGSLHTLLGATTGLPPPGVQEPLNNITGVSYSVLALDDDDWAARNVSPAGSSANIGENDAVYDDDNKKIVIRAIGFGRNNSRVTLEGIIARPELGGIVVGGHLRMMGAAGSVSGDGGSVHANGDVDVDGTPVIEGTVSAVGIVTGAPIADAILQNQEPIFIPPINTSDFTDNIDWRLTAAGWVQKMVGGVLVNHCNAAVDNCSAAADGGADILAGTWQIKAAASGRYHVIGDVNSGGDLNCTIYATGDIDIANNDNVIAAANAKGVALVSDGNINIGGGANITGSVYARGAVDFGGNHIIVGQVVAENRGNPAAENRFHGDVNIIWDGDTMIGDFGVSSWREVK